MKVTSFHFLRGTNAIAVIFITTILILMGAIINFVLRGPQRGALLVLAMLLPAAVVWLGLSVVRDRIDSRLERVLGRSGRGLAVAMQDFPDYRFVDVFKAIEAELGPGITTIESAHQEDLGAILTGSFYLAQEFPVDTSLVGNTDGATQAFLKELVSRALQFSVEAGRTEGDRVAPTTADFDAALAEIRAFDGKAARAITGFRIDGER